MDLLVPAGVVLTVLGLASLIWCIAKVWRARRSGLDDEAMRGVLRKVVPVNSVAVFVSAIGLAMVTVGALLG